MEQRAVQRRIAVAVALGVVAAGAAFVLTLRAKNPFIEPPQQNWWLVCWFVMAAGYGSAGAALVWWPARRRVAVCFLLIGAGALAAAIAVQYRGYLTAYGETAPRPHLAELDDWARPIAAGVLGAFVPWELLPRSTRARRWVRVVRAVAVVALGGVVVVSVFDGPAAIDVVASWALCVVATVALATLGVHWWRHDRRHGDLLTAWLLAGAIAAWLAVVPDLSDVADWRLPGREVVTPLLFLATVPLLVAGTVIELVRRAPSGRTIHRVVEWTILAGGIVVVYTAVVAGLGQLVGGSGPTWFLVASTGAIALALEPVRRRVRTLTDGLVYGSRDDPLVVVQDVVDRVGSGAGAELLPELADALQRELRMDAVAIDLREGEEWHRVAACGSATVHTRDVLLRHKHEVVGRLVVGWEQGPSPRPQDDEVLTHLVGPLSLAVRWVRLTDDLRRSNLAAMFAREEERRRLRRDLHDGIGPALTGISLGLRTAAARIGRADAELTPTGQLVGRLADEMDAVVADLRRIVRDLRPTALDQLGLMEAVSEFARKFDDDLEMHVVLPDAPVQLPAAVEVATYRIVTEAVTNVVRHAGAARCWLSITAGSTVGIDVVDDGVGTNGEGPSSGIGLMAMRERASELGGCVDVRSVEPHGTHLHVELPVVRP